MDYSVISTVFPSGSKIADSSILASCSKDKKPEEKPFLVLMYIILLFIPKKGNKQVIDHPSIVS